MIDPGLCLTKIGVCIRPCEKFLKRRDDVMMSSSTVEQFYAVLANKSLFSAISTHKKER